MGLSTFSFTDALIIGGAILTLVFYLLFRLCYRKVTFSFLKYRVPSRVRALLNSLGYTTVTISFILVTVYSIRLGYRPWIYFLLLSLVVVYIALCSGQEGSRTKNISIILVVSLLLPLTVLANNNFLDFGTDQGANLKRGLEIVETGGWEQKAIVSYYEPFPLLPVLLASITIVTGFSQIVYTFLLPVCVLLFGLILYLLFKRITNSERVATLSPFIFLSIPTLSFLMLLPRDLSIIFAFIGLYLVMKLIHKNSRTTVLILVPILVVMVVSHVAGVFFFLSVFLPLIFYAIFFHHSLVIPRQFRFVSILTVLVMFTYWVFNQMVLLTVMGPTKDFFSTVMEYLSGSHLSLEEAARPYIEVSSELVHTWFAWSVPPAIVAGCFLHRFHEKVVNRNKKGYNDWKHKMGEFGSVVGLVLLLISFLLAHYGHYTYLIIPTYALLFFVTILFLPRLLSSPNEFVKVITVFILAVSLLIGGSSPNWAPIENPYFPARRRLYNQIAYTSEFGQDLPQNVTLILDSNAYPDISESVSVKKLGSYRETREFLLLFERGTSINELAEDDSYIFIVRVERLVLNGGDAFNLVRSSGKYAMVTPVHYLFEEASP